MSSGGDLKSIDGRPVGEPDEPSALPAGSIPDDVRLWIAEVRDRLEHVWRDPITQDEATALITKSATLALSHNCYQE